GEARRLALQVRSRRRMYTVLLRLLLAYRTADDQRRARLVDQDRVHLVDDREVVRPLHALLERVHHVVAQVVEAVLVVRAVRDVRTVRGAPLGRARLVQVDAVDGETEIRVDRAHPLAVALRQVRVHRDQVHAATGKRVQVDRHGRNERLALTRRHLRDLAAMQRDTADQLYVVGDHVPGHGLTRDGDLRAEQAAAGLLHGAVRLRQNVVERLLQARLERVLRRHDAALQPLALRWILRLALRVAQLRQLRLEFRGLLTHRGAQFLGLLLE